MVRGYSQGYYQALDDVMNWMNSQDETNNRKFRTKLYCFCLDKRPPKIR
jgi:hypothetical protein